VRHARNTLFALLITALAVSAIAAPVSALYVHPRGLLMTIYPGTVAVFRGAPGYYDRTLVIIVRPPWYFVDDLMGFDSITLTVTLVTDCPSCRSVGKPPTLLGADANGRLVAHWGALTMSEEDNGAILLYTITFVITTETGQGFYMLYLSAEAVASGVSFQGWDQVPVGLCGFAVGQAG
jgi:hypothetical protein